MQVKEVTWRFKGESLKTRSVIALVETEGRKERGGELSERCIFDSTLNQA